MGPPRIRSSLVVRSSSSKSASLAKWGSVRFFSPAASLRGIQSWGIQTARLLFRDWQCRENWHVASQRARKRRAAAKVLGRTQWRKISH